MGERRKKKLSSFFDKIWFFWARIHESRWYGTLMKKMSEVKYYKKKDKHDDGGIDL